MSRAGVAVMAAVATVIAAGCSAEETGATGPPPAGSVWVADEAGNSLTVIDAATNTVATTLTGLPGPHNVQVGRDGSTVYATSTSSDLVVGIDAAGYRVVASARTGPAPAHVIEAPNGKVYVANSGDGTMTVRATVDTGAGPHGVTIDGTGGRAWITDSFDDTVSVVDLDSRSVVATVAVGKQPNGISYSARPPGRTQPTVALDVPGTAAGMTPAPHHEHG